MPSLQLTQMKLSHELLEQSVPTMQGWPSLQALQSGPPQSTPVSLPSLIPLEQLAQKPPTHRLLLQSDAILQAWPSLQGLQLGPPQSTPVSP